MAHNSVVPKSILSAHARAAAALWLHAEVSRLCALGTAINDKGLRFALNSGEYCRLMGRLCCVRAIPPQTGLHNDSEAGFFMLALRHSGDKVGTHE